MRKNRRRKTVLHSAMRPNAINRGGRKRTFAWILCGVLAAALSVGAWIGCDRLYALWIEQCEITDVARQVSIATGDHVKAGVILELFGIRKGANFAKIDFRGKHREILERIPNIRTLTVLRHLPDRVEIHVEERTPAARMNVKGGKARSGRVADADGVVFNRQAGTSLLPVIFEGRSFTAAGKTLAGRSRAALRLLEVCRSDFPGLGVLAVDATHPDYLLATLGNYSHAKIAWKDMDAPTAGTEPAMRKQLEHLQAAVSTGGPGVKIWNATLPNRATGDTKEPIL